MKKKTPKATPREADDYTGQFVIRSELMLALAEAIKQKGWTQTQAAEFLGAAQPRISDVVQGRVERFTADTLMGWLQKLGKDVSVLVRDNIFASAQVVRLTLYVCGSPNAAVLENIARMFGGIEERYELEIVDVLQNAERASKERISSTPCLIKEHPLPRVVLTGDLSAASVRWQLSVADRLAMDNRQAAQDLREAVLDQRERKQDVRERKTRSESER